MFYSHIGTCYWGLNSPLSPIHSAFSVPWSKLGWLEVLYKISDNIWMRRNFSLVARYLLKFTRCSLLVVKSLVVRCKICSSLVVEVARCKKSLVTRCKIRSLLVAEVARCKKLLVTRCRSCSLEKITRYSLQNSLVARCRSWSLQKITRYSLQKLLDAKNHSLLVAKNHSLLVAKTHLLVIALLISIATYYVKSLPTRANFS